ncbi:hypothetical protein F5887DRAFT_990951 [Amanita rubescens]|nr:hypothetical protein F5887DRAFT_990951 [Amanita rubescens]
MNRRPMMIFSFLRMFLNMLSTGGRPEKRCLFVGPMNMTGSVTGSRLPMNYQLQDIDNALHGTPDLAGATQDDGLQGQVPEVFLVCNGLRSWQYSISLQFLPRSLLRPRRAPSDPCPDWQS